MIAIMSEFLEHLFADAASRDFAAGEPLFRAGNRVVSMILLRQVFRVRLKADPGLAELWAKNLAGAVQGARLRAEIRSLPKVAERLDAWLGEGNSLPEKGRWQELAAEIGVTREALYRELSRRRAKE